MAIPSFLEYIKQYEDYGVLKGDCNIDYFYKDYLEHVIGKIQEEQDFHKDVTVQDMLTQIYFIAAFVEHHAKLKVNSGLITLTALPTNTISKLEADILGEKGEIYRQIKKFVDAYSNVNYKDLMVDTAIAHFVAGLGILAGLISTVLIGASFAPGISQAGFITSCFFGALFGAAALLCVKPVVNNHMRWKDHYAKQEGSLKAGTKDILDAMTNDEDRQLSMQHAVKSTLACASQDSGENYTEFARNKYYSWNTGEYQDGDIWNYASNAPAILRSLNRL